MDDPKLTATLRRCPPETHRAAQTFRRGRDPRRIAPITRGIIERFVAPELRARVGTGDDTQRLVEDLALDSPTLMEITALLEDVIEVTTTDDDLRQLHTIADVIRLARAKVQRPFPARLDLFP